MNIFDRNQREWNNSDNWSSELFGIYFSKKDSRVWVPKKFGIGWTLNFGHPHSAWWLVGFILLPAVWGWLKKK